MKRINSIFAGLGLLVAGSLSAQTPAEADTSATVRDYKVEVYEKENIPFKKPIPYAYVREADVMFEKIVWRMVDLREKRNLPLYYPTANIGSRVNLVNLLLRGVESGEVTAYTTNDVNNEFVQPMTLEELDTQFDIQETVIEAMDEDGEMIQTVIKKDRADRLPEITRLLIKEKIYFDKKHSVLNRRVIGICPIRYYHQNEDDPESEMVMKKIMWVYVPEARNILARHPVFNRFNDAQNISFDDFLMQNRYDGYIFQISNVYNNRAIQEYAAGLDVLYEAQRIENEIFDFEQDLWEY